MATKQGWARGGTIFAATLLLMIGVFQFFMGLAAIIQGNFFVVGPNYTYEINTTAWGWIHLGIGVVAAIAGFFLFTGMMWARIVAIAIAGLSAVANFFYLPYYPLWSMLIIAVDIFAIWAIATVRQVDVYAPDMTMASAGYGAPGFGGEARQTGERWPAENVPGGRHWAPDVKEGVGQPGQAISAAEAQERAAAAARGASGGGPYTAGPGGVTPPPNPPTNPPS